MSMPLDNEIVVPLRLSREALRRLYVVLDEDHAEDPLLTDVAAEIAEALDPDAPAKPLLTVHPELLEDAAVERFVDVTQRVRHMYDELLDEVSELMSSVEEGSENPLLDAMPLRELFAVLNEARDAASDPYMFMIDISAAR